MGLHASVIVPVHNGADTIAEQLDALARQTFSGGWEVVVADNGSIDRTPQLAARWADRLPHLRIVDASDRPGAAHARNVGAQAAHGRVLAFCDADDIVADTWLEALVEALDSAALAAGPIECERLNEARMLRWRPPPPSTALPISHGFMPYALGANVAFRATVFHELGGFREDYPAGEDVEITWRAQLAQHPLVFAPEAVVHYRFRHGLLPLLRQYVVYGGIGPRLFRDFASAGMPPSTVRGAVGPWLRLLARLPLALLSADARGDVLRRIAYRVGRIRGSLRSRVVYL